MITLGWPNYHLLPAFCIGYKLDWQQAQAVQSLPSGPDWIALHHHQAGGYSCAAIWVLGATLRLEANAEKGKRDLMVLIRDLRSIGEYSSAGNESDHPGLMRLAHTHGHEYGLEQMRILRNLLSHFLELPATDRGMEAFVTFEAGDPLAFFAGWRVMEAAGVSRKEPLDEDFERIVPKDELLFSGETASQLVTTKAKVPGLSEALGIHLLWENSD
jgi:hypothetical protein